jgi:hypothetical protein
MKRHIPILLVGLVVVLLLFGCNGANEVTGPQLPELRPKKVLKDPPDARRQPILVERPRAPVVAQVRPRESPPTPEPTRTPRVPPCFKNPAACD